MANAAAIRRGLKPPQNFRLKAALRQESQSFPSVCVVGVPASAGSFPAASAADSVFLILSGNDLALIQKVARASCPCFLGINHGRDPPSQSLPLAIVLVLVLDFLLVIFGEPRTVFARMAQTSAFTLERADNRKEHREHKDGEQLAEMRHDTGLVWP